MITRTEGFYRVFNRDMAQLGSGYRNVYMRPGRKWFSLLDYVTGDHVRITGAQFETMAPERSASPRIKYVEAGRKRAECARDLFKSALAAARAKR